MTVHLSRLNWGFFFVVLGGVALAFELGVIDPSLAGQLVALWPVLLIALGFGIILNFSPARIFGGLVVAATFGVVAGALIAGGGHGLSAVCAGSGNQADALLTRGGPFPPGGRVVLELSCADLTWDRQAGTEWAVQAQQGNGPAPVIEQTGDVLQLRTADGVTISNPRRSWHVSLPQVALGDVVATTNATQASIALGGGAIGSFSGTFNASDARLDLGAADMSSAPLSLTLNASSATLLLPVGGDAVPSDVTLNASSLTICAAPAFGLRIASDNTLSSDNFNAVGLERVGDGWQTPGYDTSATRMQLAISANVSSMTLDRTGACP